LLTMMVLRSGTVILVTIHLLEAILILIAPVEMDDHSFIAAGSTITKDIPKHAMAIARQRQTNKEDFWNRLPLSNSEDWK
jgi:N-acetylglucosamine-1-phosphate uridyltransferase (contains nucleotidyltransferase and I-patch acetyltransferase domains)